MAPKNAPKKAHYASHLQVTRVGKCSIQYRAHVWLPESCIAWRSSSVVIHERQLVRQLVSS
jgi:hypothetical protein